MDFSWGWFLAADFKGQWSVVTGRAFLDIAEDKKEISGFMCIGDICDENSAIYANILGSVNDDDVVVLKIASTNLEVPSFEVSGSVFSLESDSGIAYTFVLTDGTTVLGLSKVGDST